MSAVDRGRRSRRRGADAERQVVAYLRAHGWPDARRYLAGDGRQPGDIDWHPLVAVEVKDRAGSAWPSWCRQALAEAREGMVAAVVRRTRGVPDVGAWECRTPIGGPLGVDAYQPWTRDVDGVAWLAMPFGEFVESVRCCDAPEIESALRGGRSET